MLRLTLASCFALVGCASSGATTGSPSQQETTRISGGVGLPTMTVDTHPTSASGPIVVGFALDRVWGALRAGFDSVALPVASVDQATHTISTAPLRVRRRLGDVAMSKYINCGNTQGGNSADSYEIVLSVSTRAQAAESGMTSLVTSVEAQGRPITLAGEYTRCTSTGELENRIARVVTAQLNR
jgi:hypothetical protein